MPIRSFEEWPQGVVLQTSLSDIEAPQKIVAGL